MLFPFFSFFFSFLSNFIDTVKNVAVIMGLGTSGRACMPKFLNRFLSSLLLKKYKLGTGMLVDGMICTLLTTHECALRMMPKHNVERLRKGAEVHIIIYSHS